MQMIDTWLIDLDGTLYRDTDHLYNRIYSFLANHLGISLEHATSLSNNYLESYGSTLSGIINHHNIDPEYYLNTVYNNASISHIKQNPCLQKALSGIDGRIIVFSNSTAEYAWRVLDKLCISTEIDGVCDIRITKYHAKPHRLSFKYLLSWFGLVANSTIMIDDRATNLKQAKKEGMHTVLCNTECAYENSSIFIDYQIDSIETGLPDLVEIVGKR